MQAVFSQLVFPDLTRVWKSICILHCVLSDQLINNCDFHLYGSDPLTQSAALLTAMMISRLKLAWNETAEVVLVCVDPVCVASSPAVLSVCNSPSMLKVSDC